MGLSKHEDKDTLIRKELDILDQEHVLLNGQMVKPSQCYHYSFDPLHVLYNTNCPDHLMARVDAIITKYKEQDEDSA